jgi:hypothetical protein
MGPRKETPSNHPTALRMGMGARDDRLQVGSRTSTVLRSLSVVKFRDIASSHLQVNGLIYGVLVSKIRNRISSTSYQSSQAHTTTTDGVRRKEERKKAL